MHAYPWSSGKSTVLPAVSREGASFRVFAAVSAADRPRRCPSPVHFSTDVSLVRIAAPVAPGSAPGRYGLAFASQPPDWSQRSLREPLVSAKEGPPIPLRHDPARGIPRERGWHARRVETSPNHPTRLRAASPPPAPRPGGATVSLPRSAPTGRPLRRAYKNPTRRWRPAAGQGTAESC